MLYIGKYEQTHTHLYTQTLWPGSTVCNNQFHKYLCMLTHIHIDKQTYIFGWMDGWMDGWMEGSELPKPNHPTNNFISFSLAFLDNFISFYTFLDKKFFRKLPQR